MLITTEIHQYYTSYTSNPVTYATRDLWNDLRYLLDSKVLCTDESVLAFSEVWEFRSYFGKHLAPYSNLREIKNEINLLETETLGFVAELLNEQIGIRFYPNHVKRKVLIDTVQYDSKTSIRSKAKLMTRVTGHPDHLLSLTGFNKLLGEVQTTYSLERKIKGFYLN